MAVWSHAQQADVEDEIAKLTRVRLSGLIQIKAASLGGIS